MTIRKIFRTLSHPMTIKIVGILCIVGFFFILPTFAAGAETSATSLKTFTSFLDKLLSLCSRGRIILAILAGKLMTNDRVYGSILHMDVYLRKIRNIMKNFANFTLVAIVLRSIISSLVGKDKMNIKDLITKTLIAGVLIQASRFLVGAVVDLSTIAVSAVGAFPSSFLQSSTTMQTQISNSITTNVYTKYVVDLSGDSGIKPIPTSSKTTSADRGQILPTYNSVSGPLLYLGFSVFKFQNYMSGQGSSGAAELTISFLLRLVLILFYTIGLALLFIANIIRVVFLRLFIVGAPFIILFTLFKEKLGGKDGGKGLAGYLNFNIMINMIFKPVIFVAGFSMILIFVVSMQSIMQGTLPKSFNGVTIGITSGASTLGVEGISSIEVKENNVLGGDPMDTTGTEIKETGQTIFVNLLIFFLTVFLMRQFIKIAATSGSGPISDVMKPLTKRIEEMAKVLPILPFGGGMSVGAVGKFSSASSKKMLEGLGINKQGQFGELDENGKNFQTNEDKFSQFMNDKMGLASPWTDKDRNQLDAIAKGNTPAEFFTTSQELAKNRHGGLSINETKRTDKLKTILSDSTKLSNLNANLTTKFTQWTDAEKTVEDYFKKGNNAKALYDAMGGDTATKRKLSKPTYDDLKNVVFYPEDQ